ncbi:MAG: hypothetical protein F4Y99_08660, partial [Acidimicrobiaceae bacterium]|nr:hypothetical protein [Acidimicrobiaceae bacterium]
MSTLEERLRRDMPRLADALLDARAREPEGIAGIGERFTESTADDGLLVDISIDEPGEKKRWPVLAAAAAIVLVVVAGALLLDAFDGTEVTTLNLVADESGTSTDPDDAAVPQAPPESEASVPEVDSGPQEPSGTAIPQTGAAVTGVPVPAPLEPGVLSSGGEHTCGVRSDGTVECWGLNSHGQTEAPEAAFVTVSGGRLHSCGLLTDGTVICWGDNRYGQSDALTGEFASVTAGDRHSCGVRFDGSVACWGENRSRQAAGPDGQFSLVSAGGFHT